jgi:hypothetical protein
VAFPDKQNMMSDEYALKNQNFDVKASQAPFGLRIQNAFMPLLLTSSTVILLALSQAASTSGN